MLLFSPGLIDVQEHLTDRDLLWNGERGAGGISWIDRSRMGPLRGVIDAADESGRRNAYMHTIHTRVLARVLSRTPVLRRALDFGCGTGRFLQTISEHCPQVYAIDKEPSMVAASREYSGRFAAKIECCSPERTPFASNFFDFVLCAFVLCVTTTELFDTSLAEIARICNPGGSLLLMEQVTSRRGLTLSRYCSALRTAGFEVVRAYPIRSGASRFTALVTARSWIPASLFCGARGIRDRSNRKPRPASRTHVVFGVRDSGATAVGLSEKTRHGIETRLRRIPYEKTVVSRRSGGLIPTRRRRRGRQSGRCRDQDRRYPRRVDAEHAKPERQLLRKFDRFPAFGRLSLHDGQQHSRSMFFR